MDVENVPGAIVQKCSGCKLSFPISSFPFKKTKKAQATGERRAKCDRCVTKEGELYRKGKEAKKVAAAKTDQVKPLAETGAVHWEKLTTLSPESFGDLLEQGSGVLNLDTNVDITSFSLGTNDELPPRKQADLLCDLILEKLGYRFVYVTLPRSCRLLLLIVLKLSI
jgi:hypothetical protein